MKIIAGNKDLTELIEQITWSGDSKQVSRKIVFTIVQKHTDYYLPKVSLSEGSEVIMQDDKGKVVFGGIIFDIEKSVSANVVTYTAFDLLFYINKSSISKIFNTTPENITSQICSELCVPFGSAALTGITVYMPCLGKTGYEGIMMAYTAAGKQNGKKYIPLMKDVNKLCVIEKGTHSGVILDGEYNLIDASYKTSLQNIVNKVLITDKSGNVVDKISDTNSMSKYGTIQKVYKQEDGKDAITEAKALMEQIEQSGNVVALSDLRAVSGYAIAVREPTTGLYGNFFIESDTHTFTNGKSEMQLTLAFQNIMDEKEIEKSDN